MTKYITSCVVLRVVEVTCADVACVGTFRFGDSVLFPFGQKMVARKTRKISEEGVFWRNVTCVLLWDGIWILWQFAWWLDWRAAMGDLGFLLLWSSGSTEFFSQLEMSRAWVCVEWNWGCSNPNSLSTMILKHFQFRILLAESCRRMPPRKKTELALVVLRAFPALRAALWTCSQQRKVWCRRSSWKAQKEY